MHAVILAGGFATRLWPLTIDTPKPLLPLAGKPIISHLIEKISADIPIIVSTSAPFARDFQLWQKGIEGRNITLHIEESRDDQSKKGALLALADLIEKYGLSDILVLAGDNIFDFELADFLAKFQGNPLLAVYDVKDIAQASKYGIVIHEGGRVKDFEEKPANPRTTFAATACYVFPGAVSETIVNYAKDNNDNLGHIFSEFLARGIVCDVFECNGFWSDIGAFDSYLEAHNAIGGSSFDESYANFNNVLIGNNHIEDGCEIHNSTIKNCIIRSGCAVSNCKLENCIVGENCFFDGINIKEKMVKAGTSLL